MARVAVEGTDIVVRLAWWEKLAARRRGLRVPVAALRGVHVEPDWWRALRGAHVRGIWIPERLYAGIRQLPDGQDFAVIRERGPVLCVELRRSAPFRRLALSVPEPDEALRALRPYVPHDRLR
ncbi:hypothetical protein ABT063_47745 [Streptomyces sp. NPDC002838]|uniref:hypothetical protein n=1 Tax=Streptomyces sp. NPDC002838 TaxID=3154436 RepID=UPI003324CDC1